MFLSHKGSQGNFYQLKQIYKNTTHEGYAPPGCDTSVSQANVQKKAVPYLQLCQLVQMKAWQELGPVFTPESESFKHSP